MRRSTAPLLVAAALAGVQVFAADTLSEGEIRKIDKGTAGLTIQHGELKNLGMPPMTMVFRLKDTARLPTLKVGDKVRFRAEMEGASYVVTVIEPR
jgi:Cu(I)/Ag(I) efflux system periplasmic protein CusF